MTAHRSVTLFFMGPITRPILYIDFYKKNLSEKLIVTAIRLTKQNLSSWDFCDQNKESQNSQKENLTSLFGIFRFFFIFWLPRFFNIFFDFRDFSGISGIFGEWDPRIFDENPTGFRIKNPYLGDFGFFGISASSAF